jgi:hypothetical protein
MARSHRPDLQHFCKGCLDALRDRPTRLDEGDRLFPISGSEEPFGLGPAHHRSKTPKGLSSGFHQTLQGACRHRGTFLTMSRLQQKVASRQRNSADLSILVRSLACFMWVLPSTLSYRLGFCRSNEGDSSRSRRAVERRSRWQQAFRTLSGRTTMRMVAAPIDLDAGFDPDS